MPIQRAKAAVARLTLEQRVNITTGIGTFSPVFQCDYKVISVLRLAEWPLCWEHSCEPNLQAHVFGARIPNGSS